MAGARKAWWRRSRWLAAIAVLCLVLVPAFVAMGPIAVKAAPVKVATAVHLHADGTAHHHADKSHHEKTAADADAGKDHSGCADGCCLGKGCPLCSLAIGASEEFGHWAPSVSYLPQTAAGTSGVAPPPPSEPPRS